MPVYKIHRLKESQQQHFRWAPHSSGSTAVKPRDYQEAGQVEAPSPYAAWIRLREAGDALRVGDLLECGTGELRICKYVGFEEAHWLVPEAKADSDSSCPDAAPAGPQHPRSE